MASHIDWNALAPWAHLLWSVVLTVYVWWATRKKARKQMIEEINAAISERPTKTELDAAVARIETRCKERKVLIDGIGNTTRDLKRDLEHMPTPQDLQAIGSDMNALRREISQLCGRLEGINRATDLMNEFLINQGAKGP